MKTIRNKMFETNSSSSHTLSIEKVGEYDIIINNGILNICDLFEYIQRDDNYYSSEIIRCDTQNKKLAMAFAILKYQIFNDWREESYKQKYLEIFEELKEKYNITEVIGEYDHAWDEEDDLQTLIDNIQDNSIVVVSKYTNN